MQRECRYARPITIICTNFDTACRVRGWKGWIFGRFADFSRCIKIVTDKDDEVMKWTFRNNWQYLHTMRYNSMFVAQNWNNLRLTSAGIIKSNNNQGGAWPALCALFYIFFLLLIEYQITLKLYLLKLRVNYRYKEIVCSVQILQNLAASINK